MAVVRDGDTDLLARCLVYMPDKQAAAHIAIKAREQRTTFIESALDTGLSLEACRTAETGRSGRTIRSSSYRARSRHSRFSRRGARVIG